MACLDQLLIAISDRDQLLMTSRSSITSLDDRGKPYFPLTKPMAANTGLHNCTACDGQVIVISESVCMCPRSKRKVA